MAFVDLADTRVQHFILQGIQHFNTHRSSKKQEQLLHKKHESERQMLLDLKADMQKLREDLATGTIAAQGVVFTEPEPAKAEPYSRYAPDMDVSVGCVPCTRAHLATISGAMQQGDVAAAREEITALLEYDLTPEKLAATPEQDRAVLAKYADRMKGMNSALQGPAPELTVASASLKEALRFAREDGLSHPEVQLRVQRTEEAINGLERAKLAPERMAQLSPEQQQAAKGALPELRRARQDLLNHTQTVDDLEAVTARIAVLDQTLNPAPDGATVQQLAQEAQKLNTEFRGDILTAWRTHNMEGDADHEPGENEAD